MTCYATSGVIHNPISMSRENQGYVPEEARIAEKMNVEATRTGEEKEAFLYPDPKKRKFSEKNNTLVLGVDKKSFDFSNIKALAAENGFAEKDELHITVLGFKNGDTIKKLLKKMSPEERDAKMNEIRALVDTTDWKFVPEDQQYHIAKEYPKDKNAEVPDQRETYIQMIQLPAMKEFYDKLNALLGEKLEKKLEPPPPHITLFTKGTDEKKAKDGIGIISESEFASLNPERI